MDFPLSYITVKWHLCCFVHDYLKYSLVFWCFCTNFKCYQLKDTIVSSKTHTHRIIIVYYYEYIR